MLLCVDDGYAWTECDEVFLLFGVESDCISYGFPVVLGEELVYDLCVGVLDGVRCKFGRDLFCYDEAFAIGSRFSEHVAELLHHPSSRVGGFRVADPCFHVCEESVCLLKDCDMSQMDCLTLEFDVFSESGEDECGDQCFLLVIYDLFEFDDGWVLE